jgi:hypothetical protein
MLILVFFAIILSLFIVIYLKIFYFFFPRSTERDKIGRGEDSEDAVGLPRLKWEELTPGVDRAPSDSAIAQGGTPHRVLGMTKCYLPRRTGVSRPFCGKKLQNRARLDLDRRFPRSCFPRFPREVAFYSRSPAFLHKLGYRYGVMVGATCLKKQ